jgi:hypothetical protein
MIGRTLLSFDRCSCKVWRPSIQLDVLFTFLDTHYHNHYLNFTENGQEYLEAYTACIVACREGIGYHVLNLLRIGHVGIDS